MLSPTGDILTWNPGAERMTGQVAEDVLGQNYSRSFAAEVSQQGESEEVLRLAAAKGLHEEQGMRLHKDGSRYEVRTSFTAIKRSEG